MEKIRLEIAGEYYNIATDNDLEYTAQLASEVDEKIMDIVRSSGRISVTQAAVLTVLEYADNYKKSEANCENLRRQIQAYLEDAARAKSEAELAKREVARLTKELKSAKTKKKDD